jgi:hypothetical protein
MWCRSWRPISANYTGKHLKVFRHLLLETNVPYTTCQHIVCQYLKIFPYYIQHLQVLQLWYYACHLEFKTLICGWFSADSLMKVYSTIRNGLHTQPNYLGVGGTTCFLWSWEGRSESECLVCNCTL